jgi:hypothetical protein
VADAPPAEKSGSAFGFLGKKVFGKIPVWVIAVAAAGGYYWYTRYGPGKKSATAQQTDPAGNTCAALNPVTGYCPGTAEDQAALQAQATSDTTGTTDQSGTAAAGTTDTTGAGGGAGGAGGTAGTGTAGTGTDTTGTTDTGTTDTGTTDTGTPAAAAPKAPAAESAATEAGEARAAHIAHLAHVKHLKHVQAVKASQSVRKPRKGTPARTEHHSPRTNTEWREAAISNLISQGVPPDQASTSVQAHLNGQPLSPVMAANRDLAVDSIGPAPQVPPPAQVKAPATAGRST